jgi:urease accessory protein
MDITDAPGEWLPFLLQTTDALFPTGAYAHSLGLEQVAREGVVRDEGSLLEFLKRQVLPALGRLELPYLRFAYAASVAGDGDGLRAIDREIGAWKVCRELREASLQLGSRRMRALETIFPEGRSMRAEHHLTVYGMQMALGGVPLEMALLAYLYQTLAGACSATLKLIRIGQDGCQRVLRAALADAGGTVRASLCVGRGDAGWFNPLLEIFSMRHERAFERLFIS